MIAVESPANIDEVVADKGYHAAKTWRTLMRRRHRTYLPEPKRKKPWKWRDHPAEERRAITANHRRARPGRKKFQRRRSELIELRFAHVCETGGARRCWLHGMLEVSKRYPLQVAAGTWGCSCASCSAWARQAACRRKVTLPHLCIFSYS